MSSFTLTRNTEQKILGGVCSGLADAVKLDVTLVRLLVVLITLFTGFPVAAYFVMWLIVPSEKTATPLAQSFMQRFTKKDEKSAPVAETAPVATPASDATPHAEPAPAVPEPLAKAPVVSVPPADDQLSSEPTLSELADQNRRGGNSSTPTAS